MQAQWDTKDRKESTKDSRKGSTKDTKERTKDKKETTKDNKDVNRKRKPDSGEDSDCQIIGEIKKPVRIYLILFLVT